MVDGAIGRSSIVVGGACDCLSIVVISPRCCSSWWAPVAVHRSWSWAVVAIRRSWWCTLVVGGDGPLWPFVGPGGGPVDVSGCSSLSVDHSGGPSRPFVDGGGWPS